MWKWILQRLKNLTHLVREDRRGPTQNWPDFSTISPMSLRQKIDPMITMKRIWRTLRNLGPPFQSLIKYRWDFYSIQIWWQRRAGMNRTDPRAAWPRVAHARQCWRHSPLRSGRYATIVCLIDHSNPSIVFKIRELCSWIIRESAPRQWMRQCVYFHRQFFN